MTFPTFKYATDTNPGTSAIYGAPDIVYAFHVIDGSHATDRIPIAAIEGTAVALSGTQVISGAKQFNNISMEFNSPTTNKQYIVNTSDITSNRNITLPLLIADDTFVFANFTQTLTNKTLSGSQNTFSSIPASAITNTAAVLSVANTFVALQTISPTTTNAITINPPSAPVGSSSAFQGGIKVASGTIGFITTAQSGDYTTNYLDQATLTNPSSGTVTNAATLKIIGAPIASTNVTITNAYSLWVSGGNSLFAGTLTSTGGITMSSADITLGSNNLKTSNITISEGTLTTVSGQALILSKSSTNTANVMVLKPNGTNKQSLLYLNRVDDLTNWETLLIGTDIVTTGEFAIVGVKNGTGTIRSINIYQNFGTKIMSFDTGNTTTSYQDFLQTTGKKLSLNVGGTSYFIETSANQIDTFANSIQGHRVVVGATTTTEVNNVFGRLGALATTAADGFAYMPSGAGTPTGTPTAFTGKVAFYYDTTNNIIYIYNGAWKKTAALT